jgi:hypothetical protein
MHVVGAGEVQDRLAQLCCAADGLIHRSESWNTPEENLPLSRYPYCVEHDAAEQKGQHQIVHLIPVHPIRLGRRLNRRGDRAIVARDPRHRDEVGGPVLQLDPLATSEGELVLISAAGLVHRAIWLHDALVRWKPATPFRRI